MSTDADGRVNVILERAAAFYESTLWESERARSIRTFLADRGLDQETVRDFGVDYAPIGWFELQDHMRRWDYSPAELEAAGLVQRSHRSDRHYDYFRSRIIFPIRDEDGTLTGFAGLALHHGPSWPQWITSPESERFRRSSALFGLDRAVPAMNRTGRAIVVEHCLDVLRLRQEGREDSVAVVRSNVSREHTDRLAAFTGNREGIETPGRRVLGRRPEPRLAPAEDSGRIHVGPHRTAAALVVILLMILLILALWIAVPVAWLWIGSQLTDDPDPNSTVFFVIGTGILCSILGLGYVLVRLNRVYMRLMAIGGGPRVHVAWLKSLRTSGEQSGQGVLEAILVGSAATAAVAMAVWFFLFARVPVG